MDMRKVVSIALFLSLFSVMGASQQRPPKISISATRVQTPGHIDVQGSGFTPKHTVSSHLRKPDGSEYPVLPILTDDHGEFKHNIDTLLLPLGTHELWVVDETAKSSSNHVQFEVAPGR